MAIGIGHCKRFTIVPLAVVVLVQKYFPVGQTDFVICRALEVVSAIGVAQAIAIHVAEFHATDFAHDDGRRGQLDRGGAAAIDVHRGLQRTACPGIGAVGQAVTLVGHIARGGNHQAVLDLCTTRSGGGAGVDKSDGDLAIDGAARVAVVGHVADACDVGVDGVELPLHPPAIAEAAIGLCGAGEARWAAVDVGRGHVDKAPGIGVALVVVVGHIERVGLALDQRGVVAGFVEVHMGHHFALEIIRFAIGQDVVVPLCRGALGGIAIGPVLVDLAHTAGGCGRCSGCDGQRTGGRQCRRCAGRWLPAVAVFS